MIAVLAWISAILALVIVAAVTYHLVGVLMALKRGADHLQALTEALVQVRDDTGPLTPRIEAINEGLKALAGPLGGANANLGAVAAVAARLRHDRTA